MISPIGYSVNPGNDFDSRPAVSSEAIESVRGDMKSVKTRIDNRLDMLTSQLENLNLTIKISQKKLGSF